MCNFRINNEWVINSFNKFNKMYFNNEIPSITFSFSRGKKTLGTYCHLLRRIELTQFYEGKFKDDSYAELFYESVLIHEMIHAYLSIKRLDFGHGKYFKLWASKINNQSNNRYKISRLTNTSNFVNYDNLNASIKCPNNFVIFYVCKDNEKYLGKVSKKYINYIGSMMSDFGYSIKYYEPKDAFMGYTLSRTTFHYTTKQTFNDIKDRLKLDTEKVFERMSVRLTI